ncbi:MAG: aspartate--tRNA ligase [Bacteroidetes bacterium]|nr:aspartate--tRNA ligase [Bacteroidota bacterium]
MLRTHTCGELKKENEGQIVSLCGWVSTTRLLGKSLAFIDLRDRYGITQINFNLLGKFSENDSAEKKQSGWESNLNLINKLGREFVIQVKGEVVERKAKNKNIPTGEIEVEIHSADAITILNESKTPPFTIEDESDGGDELRMKYRYLDLRRTPIKNNLLQRHKVGQAVREYFDKNGFADIETPFLIKSTPEGARDFVVPSRLNPGEFYALPQSPQTFKQLLMVSGFDRYYQVVRCFRDEDLRADRQPEFTQIDCEMSFVEQEDVLHMFEGMVKHVFKKVRNLDLPKFPRMTYADAMKYYGVDKPDTRFEMKIVDLTPNPSPKGEGSENLVRGKGFKVYDDAELIGGICAKDCAEYTRKQLDELTEWVKRPQIGAGGLGYIKYNADGTLKSSFDKFFDEASLKKIAEKFSATTGDLILILAGAETKTRKALGELRLEMGNRLGLRDKNKFECLWVVDFPLLEWNEEEQRWFAMHHPFTSPKKEDMDWMYNGYTEKNSAHAPKANAYDIVINGVEIGGGSIRIHNKELQQQMFKVLGLTKEETEQKFSFILNAFEYGAPPHGGIAFGFDRLCSMVIANEDYIRDYIAFPKNNSGRDVMLDSPSPIDEKQKKELGLK